MMGRQWSRAGKALLASVAAFGLFALLAWHIQQHLEAHEPDIWAVRHVHVWEEDTRFLVPFVHAWTDLGQWYVPIAAVIVLVPILLWHSRWWAALVVAVVLLSVGPLSQRVLKEAFHRRHPTYNPEKTDFSFPSTHSLRSMLTWGLISYLLLTGGMRPGRLRRLVVGGLMLIVLGVGCGMVYLGRHFPTDILGGYLLGVGVLGLIVALIQGVEDR